MPIALPPHSRKARGLLSAIAQRLKPGGRFYHSWDRQLSPLFDLPRVESEAFPVERPALRRWAANRSLAEAQLHGTGLELEKYVAMVPRPDRSRWCVTSNATDPRRQERVSQGYTQRMPLHTEYLFGHHAVIARKPLRARASPV